MQMGFPQSLKQRLKDSESISVRFREWNTHQIMQMSIDGLYIGLRYNLVVLLDQPLRSTLNGKSGVVDLIMLYGVSMLMLTQVQVVLKILLFIFPLYVGGVSMVM
jgi:hypothetical protein